MFIYVSWFGGLTGQRVVGFSDFAGKGGMRLIFSEIGSNGSVVPHALSTFLGLTLNHSFFNDSGW